MNTQPWSWLYVSCFLDFFGASMIMPVFTSHMRTLGFSHTNVGLLSSLYGISQLISGPVIGSWSDINGRQSILCLTLIICSIGYGLMGVISSFFMFLIIRCLLGLFKHTQTLCRASTADLVPLEKQASVHGLMNAVTSFSFTIGPLISGHVMEIDRGFQILTTCVFITFLLNAMIVFLFASDKPTKKIKKVKNPDNFFYKFTAVFNELYAIKWRNVWLVLLVKFLFALTGILFFQNLGVILTEKFNITSRYMGYTISFYALITGLSNLYVGRLKKFLSFNKFPLKNLPYILGVTSVTLFLLYNIDSYPLFVTGLLPLAISHALSRILMTEMILDSSDESYRGSMMGASSSIAAVARIIAPTVGGLVMTWGGVSAPILLSAMIAGSAGVLSLISSFLYHEKSH